MSFLGLDIGTSGCKAVVFARDERILGESYRPYQVSSPQLGWDELDSRAVVESCCQVISEAAKQASSDPVVALAISSQGEAFTPIGNDGSYLGNAMVSSDIRSSDVMNDFVAEFGLERLYGITGHTPSPLFSLFKLLWIKRFQPDVWRKSAKFLCFEDLMHQRLGLDPAMGWPLAGRTMLFDIERHAWSQEILAAADLDEKRLARPLPSGALVGIIPQSVARDLGLPNGVKVAAGGHDQTIGALGAGVLRQGQAMYAAGTVECICPIMPRAFKTEKLRANNLCCYDYSVQGWYTSVAYSLTGSNLLAYFKEQFGTGRSYRELIGEFPEKPSRLLTLPYFTPSGTPYFDQHTPGAVLGWRLNTSRGELMKALVEGVAMEMRLNLELLRESGVEINTLIATGGGSRDRRLLQVKADILGAAIRPLGVDQAGCLGAARLARSAADQIPLADIIGTRDQVAGEVMPNPEHQELYARKFQDYRSFYTGLKLICSGIHSNW